MPAGQPGAGQRLALLVGLAAAGDAQLGQPGTATAVYLCVVCAMTLPNPWAIPAALVTAGAFYLAGFVVPGWEPDPGLLLSMLAATVAVWGIQQMLMRNVQLVRANEENRRLAVSEERNRFARDLHDILGHSLTVITVKAELAQRLLDVDPAAREGRGRRPGTALARRALRRTPRGGGLPRADPARRAGPRAHCARGRGDRRRPAELHRRGAQRPARALRVDGARGRHQRDPAQRRPALHRAAHP